MKLVLCSEGFRTQDTIQATVKLCNKPQNEIAVAIINEAYAVERGDKRWVLNNLTDVAKNFPAEIDMVNLLALSLDDVEKRIATKDVIFVIGGNADYQMHVFEKTGFAKLLPKLLETKVYVGSSAGSMVLGRRISSEAYHKIYGERDDFEVKNYMNLVDLAIKPHMNSEYFPNNRPEVLEDVVGGLGFPVYGLQDDSAIVIDDEDMTFVGSDPYKVS